MRALIIGAGAIGCLVGGKLARQGHAVTLVGRPAFAAKIARAGLIMTDDDGRHVIRNLAAAGSVEQAVREAQEPFDAALITVKSYDTATAVDELSAAYSATKHATPLVVSLQNGVGNEDAIAAHFGPAHTVAGTVTTPVSMESAGVIHINKPRFIMGLSRWAPAVDADAFERLWAALVDSGFDVTVYSDAQGLKWTKLLMNMVGNATSAILDMPPDRIFADRDLANVEIDAWREALAVMRARDIPALNVGGYPFASLAPLIRSAPKPAIRMAMRKMVGGARGGKMPSLNLDLHGGKGKSEVDWLNGAVVRAGHAAGVATPVNRVLTDVLLHLVESPEECAGWREDPARLLARVRQERGTN